ncbi:MAG: hypothetical protein ACT4N2_12095 [Hyphomicrobium sp.]
MGAPDLRPSMFVSVGAFTGLTVCALMALRAAAVSGSAHGAAHMLMLVAMQMLVASGVATLGVWTGAYGAPEFPRLTLAAYLTGCGALSAAGVAARRRPSLVTTCLSLLTIVGFVGTFFSVAIVELAVEIPDLLARHLRSPSRVHFFNIVLAHQIITITLGIMAFLVGYVVARPGSQITVAAR